jgi:hypothetical protein
MTDRPTLKEQIAVSKLTDQECVDLLTCKGQPIKQIDFWIFRKVKWLWSLIHWNWFDPTKEVNK